MTNMPTTLRVKFPPNWPGWNVSEYTLTVAHLLHSSQPLAKTYSTPPPKLATSLIARVNPDADAYTDYNSDTPVFRATLVDVPVVTHTHSRHGGPTPKPRAVVLKFVLREDLIPDLLAEARAYTGALAPLQGRAVPRCYGLFTGAGECGEIACLVLERWGECLRRPFGELGIDVRLKILQRLGEIHRKGLSHGDFAERNVLKKDGDIRIIDFDGTQRHECACTMDFRPTTRTGPAGAPLNAEQFGCTELWEVCRYDMRIWEA